MRTAYRLFALLTCALLTVTLLVGCAEREHRKMTVKQEQHEGPVEPVAPGEMIVE